MFTKSAHYYDALYRFKDYEGAAQAIATFVDERNGAASTLLDVACGSGKHLANLRHRFRVEGLDLNPELLEVAATTCPDVPLHEADMISFDLGKRFDVVTCLFSSISYVQTREKLVAAVAAMARHLAPGGLLLIEPWFSPDRYWVGHLAANYADEPDLKISWMYVQAVRDGLAVLDIHYQVGTPDGVHQFRELHEMGLFTDEEYSEAFRLAGLRPAYDHEGFFGRGLFWAQAAGE